ncbi:arginine repressor [soil metagenome]
MEVLKELRQQQIGRLIEERPIRTQDELATALREQGFRVTQATVSRDIAEMGLRKALRDGMPVYTAAGANRAAVTVAADDRLRHLLASLPVEIRPAGLLLVVRTVPGSAHAIAAALDRVNWPEVVGSLAGDDTLFIACATNEGLAAISERLSQLARG